MRKKMIQTRFLTKSEIREMYHSSYQKYRQIATDYFHQNGDLTLPKNEQDALIKELTKVVIISNIYFTNTSLALNEALPVLNQINRLKEQVKQIAQKAKKYQDMLNQTIRNGIRLRKKVQPFYPDLFKNGDIYVRIDPLVPVANQLEKILYILNTSLPEKEQLILTQKKEENHTKYFIRKREESQAQTAGRFLMAKSKMISRLQTVLQGVSDSVLAAFFKELSIQKSLINVEKTESGLKTVNWVTEFKKTHGLPNDFKLDSTLFFLLKQELGPQTNRFQLESVCQNLNIQFMTLLDTLNFEQTKHKNNTTETALSEETIDTVIFSNRPLHLSRMSAYVSWENISCMSPDHTQHLYVTHDIGRGTLIAYGVNSQNPTHKIARILLKPHLDKKGNVYYGIGRIHGSLNQDFATFIADFSQNYFNHPGDGKIFYRDEHLYKDNQSPNISLLENIPEACSFFNIPFHQETIKGKEYYVIEKDFSTDYIQPGWDFSNCIIEGTFTITDRVFSKNLPLRAIATDINSVQFKTNLDFSTYQKVTIYKSDLKEVSVFRLPQKELKMDNSKLPKSETLDLSSCENVTLKNCDISNSKNILMPQKNLKLIHTKLPLMDQLDLSSLEEAELSFSDLRNVKKIIPPRKTLELFASKLPFIETLDLSGCEEVNAQRTDLSYFKTIVLPRKAIFLSGAQLGELDQLDLSKIETFEICKADLSQIKKLILPKKGKVLNILETLLPHLDILDLSSFQKVDAQSADLSLIKKLKVPSKELILTNAKLPPLEVLDLSHCESVQLKHVDLSAIQCIIPPKKQLDLTDSSLGDQTILDLSTCSSVLLKNCDLTHLQKIIFPPKHIDLSGSQMPIMDVLDLSTCSWVHMNHTDLKQIKKIIPPQQELILNKANLPFSSILDLSSCQRAELKETDLSKIETLISPKKYLNLSETIFPGIVDLSNCKHVEAIKADLTNVRQLILPQKKLVLTHTRLPAWETLDLSACDEVDLSHTDLRGIKKIIPPKKKLILTAAKLPVLSILDLSECEQVLLSTTNLKQINKIVPPSKYLDLSLSKLPEKLDLSNCVEANLTNCDLTGTKSFIPARKITNLTGIWTPDRTELDLSTCEEVNLTDARLNNVQRLKVYSFQKTNLKGAAMPSSIQITYKEKPFLQKLKKCFFQRY